MASNVGNWGINLFKFAKPAPSSDKPAEKTFEKEELVKTTGNKRSSDVEKYLFFILQLLIC